MSDKEEKNFNAANEFNICGMKYTNKDIRVNMSRNLARQISRDLDSDCFATGLIAVFYFDSRAHNVRKVRVVKYIVVYSQIKYGDQTYSHNQKLRRRLKEISFRRRRF